MMDSSSNVFLLSKLILGCPSKNRYDRQPSSE